MKSGVAAIMRRFARFLCASESLAAVGIAELRVRWRTLKCVADGVVIGDGELGWLMAFNQQERQIGFSRDGCLQLLPLRERLQFFVLKGGALGGGYLFHAESEMGWLFPLCGYGGKSGG